MDTYCVRALPYPKGWEVHISGPGVDGVTQAHTLRQVEGMARDYVLAVLDLDPDTVLRLVIELADGVHPWWREARNSLRR